MGLADKAGNKAEELKGKGKEATGRATDDPGLEAEGKGDQAKGNLKQAGEKIKDVLKPRTSAVPFSPARTSPTECDDQIQAGGRARPAASAAPGGWER
ncbi:MAG: hypothetical protein DLM60_04465 [Pseudonocardiales bacterium]|nr:MAG: hypothetical protein DLM60_04465 [Pseudonocardiales bacterium]